MSEHILWGVAQTLRQWPEVTARLRELHRAGPDGRCLGCASQVRQAPRWPCPLALVSGADSPTSG
ncbi:MAG TPA: hypothetical protein VGH89_13140 [Pseudonocardia sp.]|jgi:hypothetical protein